VTFARRRNRLSTHFSERIPVVKRRVTTTANKTTEEGAHESVLLRNEDASVVGGDGM